MKTFLILGAYLFTQPPDVPLQVPAWTPAPVDIYEDYTPIQFAEILMHLEDGCLVADDGAESFAVWCIV